MSNLQEIHDSSETLLNTASPMRLLCDSHEVSSGFRIPGWDDSNIIGLRKHFFSVTLSLRLKGVLKKIKSVPRRLC